jgi:hypothetical protein
MPQIFLSFIIELTRALYHGNLAIEKRKEEHLHKPQKMKFNSEEEYNSFEKDNEGHAHIIHCLEECYDLLKVLAPIAEINNRLGPDPYGVDRCTEAFSSINIDLEDIDPQFADIRCRYLYFFLDLIELEETVVQTWKRVKNLEISLVSATVVTRFVIKKLK